MSNIIGTGTTDNDGDFIITIDNSDLNTGNNNLIIEFEETEFYTGSTQIATVNIQSETTSTPSSLTLSATKPILSSADAFKNWTHPYTIGIDEEMGYIDATVTGSGVVLNNLTLPSEFEINYKFKTTITGANSSSSLLFVIGTDGNNGILIGTNSTNTSMALYSRVNGSNTQQDYENYVYNNLEWTDVNITYENNIISMNIGNSSIEYTLSDPTLIRNYIGVYGNGSTTVKFADFKIIDLSNDNIVYSSNENISTEITATVLDENNNPCSDEIVTFTLGLHETQRTTNNNGVATLKYTAKQIGDITITATLNNLSDTITIEDCNYYNDGTNTNGLRVSSGVSCSSDGEWIVISKSSSGEQFVFPPNPLCCFNGSDNWELSIKCKTSDYSNQALAVQMNGCGYGSYSGDSQYWGYGGGAFYGYLSGSYTLLDTDKVTYKREDGYWKVYVNDNILINSKNYNWTGLRTHELYTNSGRRQSVKEWKIKRNVQVNKLELIANKSRVNIDNNETITLTATLTSLNMPVINTTITFKENGVVIGTSTTNNNGVATYTYEPSDYGDYTVSVEYSTLSESVVINANDGSGILYYNSGADLSKISDFDINNGWAAKNSSNGTYTVSSDGEEWLTITRSGGSNYGHIPIAPLTGINVSFKISLIIEILGDNNPYNSTYSGLYAL